MMDQEKNIGKCPFSTEGKICPIWCQNNQISKTQMGNNSLSEIPISQSNQSVCFHEQPGLYPGRNFPSGFHGGG